MSPDFSPNRNNTAVQYKSDPMKDVFAVVVLVLAAIMIYHTATQGRRGRRWGRS